MLPWESPRFLPGLEVRVWEGWASTKGRTENPEANLPQLFPPLPWAKITPSPSSPRREDNFRSGKGVTAAERATTPPPDPAALA